jgi:Flp pilus assembly protein TadG
MAAVVGGRADQRGSITIWVLGLTVSLLLVGGLTLDLWRTLGARRSLASIADAAAVAGANGLDEGALRDGEVRLDPDRVRALVRQSLAAQHEPVEVIAVEVSSTRVTVRLRRVVPLTIAKVFDPEPVEVRVLATAEPRLRD